MTDTTIDLIDARMRNASAAFMESFMSDLDAYWIERGYEPELAREITKIMLEHSRIEFRPTGYREK